MADVKISQLPQTSVVCANALIPIVQNGVTCSTYACNIASPSIFVVGTGCNSSIRNGVGNTASGVYSSALGGSVNCNTGINTSINAGTLNIIGCYNLAGATCLTTSSYVYCANVSTNSIYLYGDYTADLQVGNCLAYFNCYDNKTYSGVVTCSTYSGSYTEIKGICAGTSSGYICTAIRNLSLVCNAVTRNSVISGGIGNTISSYSSFIGGGCNNIASALFSFVGGGYTNNASASSSFVGGGSCNNASLDGSVVVAGSCNIASSFDSFVGGGFNNTSSSYRSFVGGGTQNTASGNCSFLGGGLLNSASGNTSIIVGGCFNTSSGNFSSIGGGVFNTASAYFSSILGGKCNTSNFADAMIVGSCITADRACATFVNNLSIKNIPTSSAGLPAGSVWSNSGVLTIV